MASIFSLFGEIFIDNEKADKAIETTTKKGEGMGTSFGAVFGNIVKGAAVVTTAIIGAATAIGTAAFATANKTAQAANGVDKMSQSLGVSRQGMQEWAYILEQNGSSIDKMAYGMRRLQNTMGDVDGESGKVAKALKELGLDFEEIQNMKPEEAFEATVKAFQDMEPGADKAKLALDVFGRASSELMPLLNSTGESVEELRQQAHDLGAVLSDDTINAGVLFSDTLTMMKTAGAGLFNQIGGALLPIITECMQFILLYMPQAMEAVQVITPIIGFLFEQMLPPLMDLIVMIFPILIDLIMMLLPFIMQIISALLPVIIELLQKLLPPIIQVVEMILPLLISLIEPLLPLLEPIFKLLDPLLQILMALLVPLLELLDMILPPIIALLSSILEKVLPLLQSRLEFVANIIKGVFKGAFESLEPVIEGVKTFLSGLIDFISGVFTGNWSKAFEGLKNIFKGVFDSLVGIAKLPLNLVITGINAFISGLNKISIPDWVPGVGGLGINIPLLPKLRIGMEYVPYDEMPALLHKGERVLTASQAEDYRSGRGGTVINIYYPTFRDKSDIDEVMDEVVSRLRLAGVRP
ncbi:MAG: hypothetical protein LBC82_01260 [Oscillospiraceae bacterium]|jgi:hypothetical protein|nr:hypothetical protein [Oscillospiraceae bacterium]